MDGLPVTVRLLDPPLHEFLPDQVDLAVEVALGGGATAEDVAEQEARAAEGQRAARDEPDARPARRAPGDREAGALRDAGPRDLSRPPSQVRNDGGDPKVEIMIPLVATAPELRQMRDELEPVAREILERDGVELSHLEWGTMIELPRAAVTAGEIAEAAEFFSFGTNDLTQTAFGFSRDDIGKFVGMYEERKLVPANPFVTIDRPGVGA